LRCLVTGGSGFIGSHLTEALPELGHTVAVVDNLSTGSLDNLADLQARNLYPAVYQIDVAHPRLSEVFDDFRPEAVFHLAAQVDVRVSVEQPMVDAKTNILGSINVLENCVRTGVAKVIFASSGGAVYGEPEYLPVSEDHCRPASPYGLAKYAVEHYLRIFAETKGLSYAVMRLANVYGPRQEGGEQNGVVTIFTRAMLAGKPVHVFGDGEQLRDYVYVSDVVQAFLTGLEPGAVGVYNIGTGLGTSVNQVHRLLCRATGCAAAPVHTDPRPGEVRDIYLSSAKINNELGWTSEVTFPEGVRRTVEYYRAKLRLGE
jgi:UDP-glucose 4-epimerase